jgi:hypothetical protein
LVTTRGELFAQDDLQQGNASIDVNKASFSLVKKSVNFGEMKMGSVKTIELSFTNTGKKTLVLNDVYTNCGCTTVDWPKDPFMPGKSGMIKITYNPVEIGPFSKTIFIYSNAQNSSEAVQIEGLVTDK